MNKIRVVVEMPESIYRGLEAVCAVEGGKVPDKVNSLAVGYLDPMLQGNALLCNVVGLPDGLPYYDKELRELAGQPA